MARNTGGVKESHLLVGGEDPKQGLQGVGLNNFFAPILKKYLRM